MCPAVSTSPPTWSGWACVSRIVSIPDGSIPARDKLVLRRPPLLDASQRPPSIRIVRLRSAHYVAVDMHGGRRLLPGIALHSAEASDGCDIREEVQAVR